LTECETNHTRRYGNSTRKEMQGTRARNVRASRGMARVGIPCPCRLQHLFIFATEIFQETQKTMARHARHITAFDVGHSSDVGVQGESENAQHMKHTHTAW